MSILVQQDATIYIFIIFLQTALQVSVNILIHHQEHTQTVITTSGTGRTAMDKIVVLIQVYDLISNLVMLLALTVEIYKIIIIFKL